MPEPQNVVCTYLRIEDHRFLCGLAPLDENRFYCPHYGQLDMCCDSDYARKPTFVVPMWQEVDP